MDACRRILADCKETLIRVAAVCCAITAVGGSSSTAEESQHVISLPEWVDTTAGRGVKPASFQVAPKPPVKFQGEPAEPQPFPTLTRLPETADPRPIRQLEHAASEARGEHALTRVIERYRSTRTELSDTGSKQLAAQADQVGSWALHARGRERSDRGDQPGAITDYRNAVRINPANHAALHDLGIALADRGDNKEALAAFSSVLHRLPDSTEALRNRAALLLRIGEADLAVVDCDRALRGMKAGTTAQTATLALRGSALHAAGRLREAAQDLDAALRQHPDDPKTRVARGHVFAEAGFYDQALADYEAALQSDSSSVEAYRSLAWVLATCPESRLRDPETAIEAAWRARRLLGSDDVLTLDASAAAHAAAGEFGEAVRLQQRLLMKMTDREDAEMASAERRLNTYKAGQPYVAKRVVATR